MFQESRFSELQGLVGLRWAPTSLSRSIWELNEAHLEVRALVGSPWTAVRVRHILTV